MFIGVHCKKIYRVEIDFRIIRADSIDNLQIILKLKCFGEKSTLLGFSSMRTYFKWPTSELNEARVLLHYRLITNPPGVVFVFLFSLIHTATEMLPVNLMNYYYAAPKPKINQSNPMTLPLIKAF